MRVSLKEDACKFNHYELSVEKDGLILANDKRSMQLRYDDMDRFWFRRFGSTVVAFVIEMTGTVYEGNFTEPSDAKRFTRELNQRVGDTMDVIFNLNQRRDRSFSL